MIIDKRHHTDKVGWPKSEARRVMVAAAGGVAAGGVAALLGPWQLAILVGWDTAALVLLVWIWARILGLNPEQTQAIACREDDSRTTSWLLLLTASAVSLAGVLLAFTKAKTLSGTPATVLTVAALGTVVCSWLLVHTVFTLRYGDLYYDEPIGGIDFKSPGYSPDYRDFAYVAFTVGMTFQVSDTDIASTQIRRTVLRQSLLSYLFGVVIVATTINIIAGLIR